MKILFLSQVFSYDRESAQGLASQHKKKLNINEHSRLAFVGCSECQMDCCRGFFSVAAVMVDELFDVAKLFPVVFRRKEGKLDMVLNFSFRAGVPCPYLSMQDMKCTVYHMTRPGVCVRFPFSLELVKREGENPAGLVSIYTQCKGLKESDEGLKVINDTGQVSDGVVKNFFSSKRLSNIEKNLVHTSEFLKLVEEFDLLATERIDVEDESLTIEKISEKKLQSLNPDQVMQLHRAGYFNAIYTHLNSLSNFNMLYKTMKAYESSKVNITD